MGDFSSMFGGGLSSLFGGGTTDPTGGLLGTGSVGADPSAAGTSVFDTGATSSPLDSFFGTADPTGSMGASFSQNFAGGGDPTQQITGTTGNQPQSAETAQAPPSTQEAGNYQPAPQQQQPVQADPAAWQIGGAGRSIGPTGFVQTQPQDFWGASPWTQSTGVPTRLAAAQPWPATFDERSGAFTPDLGGQNTTTVAEQMGPTQSVAEQQGRGYNVSGTGPVPGGANQQVASRFGDFQPPSSEKPDSGPSSSPAQDAVAQSGLPGGPTAMNTAASYMDAPPSAVDQEGTAPAATAQGDTSQVDQPGQPAERPEGGRQGPTQMPNFGRGPMNPVGNLLRDIQGAMSGNPASLMNLAGDVMRMIGGGGGMPMMPGMGGGLGQVAQQLFNQPNPASPYLQPGDPSTFGGGYAGMSPSDDRWRASPTARQRLQQQIAANRGGPNPGQPPRPGQQPGQQPGENYEDAQRRNASAAATGAPAAAAPSGAGPTGTGAAAQPLAANEVQLPAGRQAPMRPSQGSVDRSRFKNEDNQAMMERAAWMVRGELGGNASTRQQIVQLETAFNRAQYRGHSLGKALLDTRSQGGYYDGNSAHPTYRMSAKPTPQQLAQFKRDVWDPVMKGSNLSDIGYGPMTGNASQDVAANQYGRGTRGYTMQTGESYFREGPFHSPLPALPAQPPAAPSPWGDPRVTRLPQQALAS